MKPPVVSVIAPSGTGKTTLLEKLITGMKQRGYRVGAIKHDTHYFEIDHEGKDSWRLTNAGADTTLISSPQKLALVKKHTPATEPSLTEVVDKYFTDVDIVLTEGFKMSPHPKIEVYRNQHNNKLLSRDPNYDKTLIAVATDTSIQIDVPTYDINDSEGLCNLIVSLYLR